MAVQMRRSLAFGLLMGVAIGCGPGTASSAPLAMVDPGRPAATIFEQVLRDDGDDLPADLRRQVVVYPTRELPGRVVIDTPNASLYFVLDGGKAIRYAVGVGREGFTWSGVQKVSRKAEWPDWVPPPEMIQRQQYLPRWVAGGPGNPLGARAMYLGGTAYRIHGTNDPTTIGKKVSSGCIRLANADVIDLYGRVNVGTKVVVLPDSEHVQERIRQIGRTRENVAQSDDRQSFDRQTFDRRAFDRQALPGGRAPTQTGSGSVSAFGLY